jgi:hypothetical protein
MATRNPVQNVDANTSLANGEFIEYRLKPQVSGTFALEDGNGQAVISHTDFPPMSDECVWQLKAALNGGGDIVLTVPQVAAYSNSGSSGAIKGFVLALGFFTAPGYALNVSHSTAAGVVSNVRTVTYSGGKSTDDPALETVNVVLA